MDTLMGLRTCGSCAHKRCEVDAHEGARYWCIARDDVDIAEQCTQAGENVAETCPNFQYSEGCIRTIARQEAADMWEACGAQDTRDAAAKVAELYLIKAIDRLEKKYGAALSELGREIRAGRFAELQEAAYPEAEPDEGRKCDDCAGEP